MVVQEQFDFIAIGDGPDGELGVGRPVPFEDRRGGAPGEIGLFAGENENLQHGIVAPIGGALVEPRLFPCGQIQKTGLVAALGKFARLTEIINAGPNEVADHVVVVAHAEPIMDAGRGFSAQTETVRESRAIGSVGVGSVKTVNVVVAGDVEFIHEAVSRGIIRLVARGSRRPGGVFLVADGDQFLRHFPAVVVELVGDFIADAVEHHARMVAVATQHGAQVGLVPLVEVEVIAVL